MVTNLEMCRYFLSFAAFSFIGWMYESAYYTFQQRRIVNSGFLSTCFCPIYGIGALLDLILLRNIENGWILFFAGILITGMLEYFVSWLMEKTFHQRWWDYTGWPLNINGRICIISVGMFGIGTVALIKYIEPFTSRLITSMDPRAMQALAVIVACVMLVDSVKSVRKIDTDKLWYVERQAEAFENNRVVNRIKNTFRK